LLVPLPLLPSAALAAALGVAFAGLGVLIDPALNATARRIWRRLMRSRVAQAADLAG
jgi:hypothetical protein